MNQPKGYFDREATIRSHDQMIDTLKARTQQAVAQNPNSLHWLDPVKNRDGSGHQNAAGTDYQIRKTLSNGQWIYWAWAGKKLLGYSGDVELARSHCEAHIRGGHP